MAGIAAGEIAFDVGEAIVYGAQRGPILSDFAGAIGAGITGGATLTGLLYGAMAKRKGTKTPKGHYRKWKRQRTNGGGGGGHGGGGTTTGINRRTGGFLGLESKFVDYEHTHTLTSLMSSANASPTTPQCINAVAQDNTASGRDGFRTIVTNVMLRGHVQFNAATGSQVYTRYVRIFLVLDKQTNGAKMSGSDMYKAVTNTANEGSNFRKLENAKRFHCLKEITVMRHPGGMTHTGTLPYIINNVVPFEMYCKTKIPVQYAIGGTGAVITNIIDNSIHVLAVGTNGVDADLTYTSRVRFLG